MSGQSFWSRFFRSQSSPARSARPARRVSLGALLLVGFVSQAATAEANWGFPYSLLPRVVRPAPLPPDQSWMNDVAETRSSAAKTKVAVFPFAGDDVYEPVRAAVVRTLRRRALNVTANLRPVDSAIQYREMSTTLNVVAFVEGDMQGEGKAQKAHIRLRSGTTGRPMASATFTGTTPKIVADVQRTLWNRLGPAVSRARATAARGRRQGRPLEREPTRIDASSPTDGT